MIQIATFLVPQQQKEANDFLRTHKPAGEIHFNKDTIFVFWEDGVVTPEYEIAELQELLQSVRASKRQQEIALFTMQEQLKTTPTNLAQYDQLSTGIKELEQGKKLQESKEAYLNERIAFLREK